jgi:hypothetical protein
MQQAQSPTTPARGESYTAAAGSGTGPMINSSPCGPSSLMDCPRLSASRMSFERRSISARSHEGSESCSSRFASLLRSVAVICQVGRIAKNAHTILLVRSHEHGNYQQVCQ